ncbi:hypothetical protein SESBI_49054 [Sesbania bispinosa]|nr:hypothetical protein SESBI_49054 [Sesbania bispinosa]
MAHLHLTTSNHRKNEIFDKKNQRNKKKTNDIKIFPSSPSKSHTRKIPREPTIHLCLFRTIVFGRKRPKTWKRPSSFPYTTIPSPRTVARPNLATFLLSCCSVVQNLGLRCN